MNETLTLVRLEYMIAAAVKANRGYLSTVTELANPDLQPRAYILASPLWRWPDVWPERTESGP